MISLREKEIFRYLGYHGVKPTLPVRQRVEACVLELQKTAQPKTVSLRFPLLWDKENPSVVHIAGMSIVSRDLAGNLAGCQEAFLFAATIGPGPDRLIRRAELSHMADAAIYQAASSEMIEAVCRKENEALRLAVEKNGMYLRPRYSPGYGDCPLDVQKGFSSVLNLPKTIGVFLTDSLLMTPSKSVTAFIGISRTSQQARKGGKTNNHTCISCPMADCLYREENDFVFGSEDTETAKLSSEHIERAYKTSFCEEG